MDGTEVKVKPGDMVMLHQLTKDTYLLVGQPEITSVIDGDSVIHKWSVPIERIAFSSCEPVDTRS